MDEVITRILETERRSAADVEQAELHGKEHIDALKRSLEEKMIRERNQITLEENFRFTKAVEEARKKTTDVSVASQSAGEYLFQDPVLVEVVKEDILSILLAGGES